MELKIELIRACIKGDAKAEKALYDKYSRTMFGLCMRYCKNRQDAEDVFQEGFINVYSNLKNYGFKGSFEGWMKRIFINQAINYYRYDDSDKNVDEIYIDNNAEIRNYSRFTNYEIMESIQKLNKAPRLVFNMIEVEGYTYKETAKTLDIKESTVRTHYHIAKKELREILEELEKN